MNIPTRPPRHPAGSISSAATLVLCIAICIGALKHLTPVRSDAAGADLPGPESVAGFRTDSPDCADRSGLISTLTARTLRLCREQQWSPESVEILNNFLRTADGLEPIASEILSRSASIPRAPRISILGTLAQRALENGDVALAETMERHILDAVQTLTADLLRQVVTTIRPDEGPVRVLCS